MNLEVSAWRILLTLSLALIFLTCFLRVSFSQVSPEEIEGLRLEAEEAIKRAQGMIGEAKKVGVDTVGAESLLARAMREFAEGNHAQAKGLADAAYTLALWLYNEKVKELRGFMVPIQFALLVILLGASIVTIVMLYEVYRVTKRKEVKAPIAKGVKCPECGKDMAVAYEGNLIIGYVCPSCKHIELKEKLMGFP
ncbi:MAG: hypothetical protein QMD12_02910 [Candidatus Aenigmarchaeota archaeon]|nr:hypothetical protein [Candidatus Aenigmarchaeota archaeon]